MQPNGTDEYSEERRELRTLVARLNDTLRDFFVEQRLSSERLGQAESAVERLEAAVEGLTRIALEIRHHIGEARGGLDKLREETNPRLRLPAAPKDGDGFEITDEQVRLPRPWATGLLKAAMSAGGGALLLRAVQWLASGH